MAQSLDGCTQLLLRDAGILENATCRLAVCKQCQQQWFHAHKFVTHLLGIVLSLQQYLIGGTRQVWFTTRHLRQVLQFRLYQHLYLLCIDTQLLQQVADNILGFLHDACQQVYRFDGLLPTALCSIDGFLYRLLRLNSKLV